MSMYWGELWETWDLEEQQKEVKQGIQDQCKQDQYISLVNWVEPLQGEHLDERFAQFF